jgi:hypothetical protein
MDRRIKKVGEGLTINRYVSFQYLVGFETASMSKAAKSSLSHNQYSRSKKILNTS